MDGLDLARHIRSEPTIAGVLLLMLTSSGPPEDENLCRELQISVCLTKPVRQSELLNALIEPWHPTASPMYVPTECRPGEGRVDIDTCRMVACTSCWRRTIPSTRRWPYACSSGWAIR